MNRLLLSILAALIIVSLGFGATSPALLVFSAKVDNNWDLYSAEGTKLSRITTTPLDERGAAISSDGKNIAYTTSDGSLWAMNLGSRERTQLGGPPGQYGYPTWVPGKSEVVYTLYSFKPPSEDADFYRCVISPRQYSLFIRQTGPQDYISFSPKGDRIAYISSVASLLALSFPFVSQQLWIMSLQSGKPEPLFWGSSKNSRPSWAPDGEHLAFSSDRSGSPQVWVADFSNGGTITQLTSGAGDKISPCWARDHRVYYVSNESGIDEINSIDPTTRVAKKEKPFGSQRIPIQDLACS